MSNKCGTGGTAQSAFGANRKVFRSTRATGRASLSVAEIQNLRTFERKVTSKGKAESPLYALVYSPKHFSPDMVAQRAMLDSLLFKPVCMQKNGSWSRPRKLTACRAKKKCTGGRALEPSTETEDGMLFIHLKAGRRTNVIQRE